MHRRIVVVCAIFSQVAHKITRVTVQGHDQVMLVAQHVPPAQEPAALGAALQHIQSLCTPPNSPPELVLDIFTMSPALVAEMTHIEGLGWLQLSMHNLTWPEDVTLITPLPPLYDLAFEADTVLNDSLLTKVLANVTHIGHKLYFDRVKLRTQLPVGVQLSFRAINVYDTDAAELIRNANILGPGVSWECEQFTFVVSSRQVSVFAVIQSDLSRCVPLHAACCMHP